MHRGRRKEKKLSAALKDRSPVALRNYKLLHITPYCVHMSWNVRVKKKNGMYGSCFFICHSMTLWKGSAWKKLRCFSATLKVRRDEIGLKLPRMTCYTVVVYILGFSHGETNILTLIDSYWFGNVAIFFVNKLYFVLVFSIIYFLFQVLVRSTS